MEILQKLESLNKIKIILIILGIGFFVYFNSLFNGFVWDDEEQIVKNTLIQNGQNLISLFQSSTFYSGGREATGWFYRPVMTFSYLINWNLGQGQPFVFHLFQVLLHLVNGILIYYLFRNLFVGPKYQFGNIMSFFLSLIFVIHPGLTEAVSYIAATQEVLSVFFLLLTILLLVKSQEKTSMRAKHFIALGLLMVLALLSKESAIIIFPLGLLFCVLFSNKTLYPWLLTSLVGGSLYFFLRLAVAHIPFGAVNVGPVAEASLTARLTSLPYAFFSYLRIIFFPKDLFISQHFLVESVSDYRFWLNMILILILMGFLLFRIYKTKDRLLIFYSFWFLSSITLVLNIIPLDMIVAERWLYFPFIGFLGTIGVLLGNKKKLIILFISMMFLIIPLLSLRTIVRNRDWSSGLTLYSHDLLLNQNAFDIQNNYGVEEFRAGNYRQAREAFEKSIEAYPKWWFAYNNLGAVYEREGNLLKARELYEKTISLSDYYLAYENLGFNLLKTGKKGEAVTFLSEAVLKLPLNSRLHSALAIAYYQERKPLEAEKEARIAYSLEPSIQNGNILEAILGKKTIE